jgi:ABC-type multidrug transport system permease subunit
MRNVIITFVLLAGFAGYGWHALAGQTATRTIVLTGFVEGQERIVRSEVAGRVLDVQVREGDTVDAGRLLVRIDRRDAARAAADRTGETYEHLLALPIGPVAVLIGKVLPYFGVAYAWMLTYYAAADVVFGVAVRGGTGLLLFATLVFLLTSYAIAVLFSTVARNTHQAVYLTVFSVLPSTVISGFLVPTSTMPRAIQIAALGLPATHYVTILRAVVVRGAHRADVAAPLVAMTAILGIVVACVLALYPRRLDR